MISSANILLAADRRDGPASDNGTSDRQPRCNVNTNGNLIIDSTDALFAQHIPHAGGKDSRIMGPIQRDKPYPIIAIGCTNCVDRQECRTAEDQH
jgi:hypothetical protein